MQLTEQVHTAQHHHQHQYHAADPHDCTAEHQHGCPSLPSAVLTTILQHLHLQHRLTVCALVCKSWAAAVANTTAAAAATLAGPDYCLNMQEWVQLWAPQLSSLDLSYCMPDGDKVPNLFTTLMCRMLLPCSKLTMLTSLSLSHLPVMFLTQQLASSVGTNNMQRASTEQFLEAAPSSSGSAGMLRMQPSGASPAAAPAAAGGLPAFLPALCELCLYDCRVRDEGFLQLSQLTGLTSLRLVEVTLCAAGWAAVSKRRAQGYRCCPSAAAGARDPRTPGVCINLEKPLRPSAPCSACSI